MNQQIPGWGASLMSSLSSALALLFAAVPRIFGFLIVLGIGWLLAWLVERVIVALLRAVHVDRFADRAGIAAGALGTIVRDLYGRNMGTGSRTIDGTLAAANQPRNVGFNGIDQRRAPGDRRGHR